MSLQDKKSRSKPRTVEEKLQSVASQLQNSGLSNRTFGSSTYSIESVEPKNEVQRSEPPSQVFTQPAPIRTSRAESKEKIDSIEPKDNSKKEVPESLLITDLLLDTVYSVDGHNPETKPFKISSGKPEASPQSSSEEQAKPEKNHTVLESAFSARSKSAESIVPAASSSGLAPMPKAESPQNQPAQDATFSIENRKPEQNLATAVATVTTIANSKQEPAVSKIIVDGADSVAPQEKSVQMSVIYESGETSPETPKGMTPEQPSLSESSMSDSESSSHSQSAKESRPVTIGEAIHCEEGISAENSDLPPQDIQFEDEGDLKSDNEASLANTVQFEEDEESDMAAGKDKSVLYEEEPVEICKPISDTKVKFEIDTGSTTLQKQVEETKQVEDTSKNSVKAQSPKVQFEDQIAEDQTAQPKAIIDAKSNEPQSQTPVFSPATPDQQERGRPRPALSRVQQMIQRLNKSEANSPPSFENSRSTLSTRTSGEFSKVFQQAKLFTGPSVSQKKHSKLITRSDPGHETMQILTEVQGYLESQLATPVSGAQSPALQEHIKLEIQENTQRSQTQTEAPLKLTLCIKAEDDTAKADANALRRQLSDAKVAPLSFSDFEFRLNFSPGLFFSELFPDFSEVFLDFLPDAIGSSSIEVTHYHIQTF